MTIHVEHLAFHIVQLDEAFSQMLLKGFTALCGTFDKKAILGGGRANKGQTREQPEIRLAYGIHTSNAFGITEKRLPDQLKGDLFSRDTGCFGGTQLPQSPIKAELHKIRDEKKAAGMGGGHASSEHSLQLRLQRLPGNFDALRFQGPIQDLHGLRGQQGPGTFLYFFRCNFFY